MIWRPPSSTRFPYTTLFRSCRGGQPGLGESGGLLQHAAGRPVLRRVVGSTSRRRAADGPLAGEIHPQGGGGERAGLSGGGGGRRGVLGGGPQLPRALRSPLA